MSGMWDLCCSTVAFVYEKRSRLKMPPYFLQSSVMKCVHMERWLTFTAETGDWSEFDRKECYILGLNQSSIELVMNKLVHFNKNLIIAV